MNDVGPHRSARVRGADALAGDDRVLAEDSGLLLATGHRVVVDDLFLWSRSVANGTIDPAALLAEVAAARFTAIVSEADLSQLAAGPAYERSRWEPSLRQVRLRPALPPIAFS